MRIPSLPVLLVFLSSLVATGRVAAQEADSWLLIGAGVSAPVGDDLAHGWKLGWGVGAEVRFDRSPHTRWALGADISFHGIDESELRSRGAVPATVPLELDGGTLTTFRLGAGLDVLIGDPVRLLRPYVPLRLNFTRVARGDLRVESPDAAVNNPGEGDSGMGLTFGLGLDIGRESAVGGFVEARYEWAWDFSDPPDLDRTWVPVRIGLIIPL